MNKLKEFKCYDDTIFLGIAILGLALTILFVAIFIGVVVRIVSGMDYYPNGLGWSIIALFCFILSIFIFVVSWKIKRRVFLINEEYCFLVSKNGREEVKIKRALTDIKFLEIKDFGISRKGIKTIVFIDSVGVYGTTSCTLNNSEYIKIKYSKGRINKIKKFLPNCVVIDKTSENC
ncbi:MAG: hypothetical protein ACI4MH_01790 [Candidatus Coproplasma sp.]